MTSRHRHKRRTFPCPQPLWDAFKALHGARQASARLRVLIEQDIAHHRDHTFRLIESSADMQAPPGGSSGGRQDNNELVSEHAQEG